MTEVIGFDLDDTLVPEALFIRSGIRHIASWLHARLPQLQEHLIISCMDAAVFTRRNHYAAVEKLLSEKGFSENIDMKDVVAEFRSHFPDSSIYHPAPSVVDALQKLKDDGVRMVLVTDGRSVTQRNKIKAAGLLHFFDDDDIYISEETGHDKYDPDIFIRIMDKYAGADGYHYVGDNPSKDFRHPSRLGWYTHQVHPFPLMIHLQGMPR